MNRKGMTVIELVVAFSLSTVIGLFLIQIVLFLNDNYTTNNIKSELVLKQSLISDRLNTLIRENTLTGVSSCGDNCYNLEFSNIDAQILSFDSTSRKVVVGDYVATLPKGSIMSNIVFKIEELNNGALKLFNVKTQITNSLLKDEVYSINVISEVKDVELKVNGTVVYFDVLKGKKCYDYHSDNSLTNYNGTSSTKTTDNQNSCLKFYAFNYDEGDDKVNLLLDHNTTASVYWTNSSTNSNTNGPINVINQLKTDTSSWVGTITPTNYTVSQTSGGNYTIDYSTYKARLITANEIAKITENNSFNEITTNYDNWFYFDTNTTTRSDTCKSDNTTGCSYGWLYDRTSTSCTTKGCLNNSDSNISGYWTSNSASDSPSLAWVVDYAGDIGCSHVNESSFGIRPVIEVSKSKIK